MRRISIAAICTVLFAAFLLASCGPSYEYQVPTETQDGWQTASLESVGLNQRKLGELAESIDRGKYENIHSILIVKNGKLVFEEYYSGYTFDYFGDQFKGEYREYGMDTLHNMASVTKAYTSALLGAAVDHGLISAVDQPIFDFFPEYSHLNDTFKNQITIEHLLTMTSGLQWNEGDVPLTDTERNDLIRLFAVSDPIEYILAKPAVAEPGKRFYYSGGDVNLLGEVIRRATGLRVDDFAEKYLFDPLGITDCEWTFFDSDVTYTSGDLKLTPRDMAKLGQLYLDGGVWNGKRIFSQDWARSSTTEQVPIPPSYMAEAYGSGYGYQWFIQTLHVDSVHFQSFERDGWGGQRIQVFPSLNMVVVLTGGNYATEPTPVNDILQRYVLPAVE